MGGLHIAITQGRSDLALAAIPLFVLSQGLTSRDLMSRVGPLRWIVLCSATAVLLPLAAWEQPVLLNAPILLPLVINLFLLFQFGRTLLPGCEPLIVRYCRIALGTVPADVQRYARRLTTLWSAVFLFMAVECAVLAEFSSVETWSLFANVLNYIIIVALFVGEHAVRSLVFPQYGIALPLRTGMAMWRSSVDAMQKQT